MTEDSSAKRRSQNASLFIQTTGTLREYRPL